MISFKKMVTGILLMSSLQNYAQTNQIKVKLPSTVPVSPQATLLMKFVDYPVDYSVGLADVSIPLYEIKVGDLILPISISYHGSGLKPRELSGWVGQNWSLNAAPYLARNVNGLPDNTLYKGYIFNDYNANINAGQQAYYHQLMTDQWDDEPDGFYYKLLADRGSFYLNRKYHGYYSIPYHGFVTQPYNAVYVTYGQDLDMITIRDKDGAKYDFGGSGFHEHAYGLAPPTTGWLCRSVQGAKTEARMDFSYFEENSLIAPPSISEMVTVEDQKWQNPTYTETSPSNFTMAYTILSDGTKQWANADYVPSHSSPASYTAVSEKKLKEISFDNGKVTFSTTNDNSEYGDLSAINVYDKEGTLIKQINFFVSLYNWQSELKKLDSIQIKGAGIKAVSYKFEYADINQVPVFSTKSIDHWGYFNMTNNTGSSVPLTTVSSTVFTGSQLGNQVIEHTIGGSNREPNFNGMKVGSLTTMTSPEGLKTRFSYAPHKYGYVVHPTITPTFITGGMRIASIETYDSRNPSNGYIRTFQYGESFKVEQYRIEGDWGVPKHVPTAIDYAYSKNKITVGWEGGAVSNSRLRFWTSNPIKSITYNNGSSMMYGTVTEKYTGNADGRTLVTRRRYHVPNGFAEKPVVSDLGDRPFDTDPKLDFNFGQMISEEKMRDDGLVVDGERVYTPVSKTEYVWSKHKAFMGNFTGHCDASTEYTFPCVDGIIRFAKIYDRNALVAGFNHNSTLYEDLNYVAWGLDNGCMKVDKETTTTYSDGVPLVQTKEYTYDEESDHMLPTKIVTSASDGSLKNEYFSYAEDFLAHPDLVTDPEDLGQAWLMANRQMNNLLQYKEEKNGASETTRMKYNGKYAQLVKTKDGTGINYENRTNFHTYDAYGNVAEVSYEKGPHTCYLWSYNNQSPVAKIEGLNYSELITVFGQQQIDGLRVKSSLSASDIAQIDGLRALLPASMVTTYTYKPLVGVSSITDPKGQTSYYEYDEWRRLARIYTKDKDANGQLQVNTRKYFEYNDREAY